LDVGRRKLDVVDGVVQFGLAHHFSPCFGRGACFGCGAWLAALAAAEPERNSQSVRSPVAEDTRLLWQTRIASENSHFPKRLID
jgi:hypothetical protein